MEDLKEEVDEDIDNEVVDDVSEGTTETDEEVITYVENDIVLFKIESIVLKVLVTKKVKKGLQNCFRRLETKCKFIVKESNYLIEICGQNRDKVIESKMCLNRLLSVSRRKRPFTHLITVPFNCEPLQSQFIEFKNDVLNSWKDLRGIEDTLFQQPFKLHLTFCVLVLLNQNEVIFAKELLTQSLDKIVRPIIKSEPLKVIIKGLDVIKGNPKRCHVLYAQIKDESNRLQTIADQMVAHYVKSGLLEESDQNNVKLHITFLNSLFRQRILHKNRDSNEVSKKQIKREPFDAKEIIERYKDHIFCELEVKNIQLNDIKTKSKEGFYGLVHEIQLND